MFNYPVILNLSAISCLVVGAGRVGVRKALQLLEAGAQKVKMVAPSVPSSEESGLAKFSAFERSVREFCENDLLEVMLVFAATNNSALNQNIAKLCKRKGILCNNASFASHGSFSVPPSVRSGGLNIFVGAGQAGPALSKLICKDLGLLAQQRYEKAVEFMNFARPVIIAQNLPEEPKGRLLAGLAELSLNVDDSAFFSLKPLMDMHLPIEFVQKIEERFFELKERQP